MQHLKVTCFKSHTQSISVFVFCFFKKCIDKDSNYSWNASTVTCKRDPGCVQGLCVCVCVCVYVYVFFTEVSPEAEGGPGIQKSHNKYLLNEQERSSWLFLVITFHCHIWMNFDVGYQKVVESFSLKYLYCPIIQYGSHQLHAISMLQDTYNITKSH